jgi:Mg-chelatase subunit ChlD
MPRKAVAVQKKKSTVSHSSYWIDPKASTMVVRESNEKGDDEESPVHRLLRLAAVRRGVANFVSILSGKNIPVHFSTGPDSYTDGTRITISSDDKTENFDSTVGLALHEGSHILLSDFNFLQTIVKFRDRIEYATMADRYLASYKNGLVEYTAEVPPVAGTSSVLETMLHPDVFKHIPAPCIQYEYGRCTVPYAARNVVVRMFNNIRDIMNILEDRRIDQYVYQRAQGYRPYYDALYNKYFFTKDIGKGLRYNEDMRKITVENYINRILFAFHPDSDLDAMPGLRDMVAQMDLLNISRLAPENDPVAPNPQGVLLPAWCTSARFNDMPILWQEANKLYALILQYASVVVNTPPQLNVDDAPSSNTSDDNNSQGVAGSGNEDETENDSPEDNAGEEENMSPTPVPAEVPQKKSDIISNEKLQRVIDNAKNVLRGTVKKKAISKKDNTSISAMEESSGTVEMVNVEGAGSTRVLVTRKLTQSLFAEEWFIFGTGVGGWVPPETERALVAGRRMGAILQNRLQVRNDPVVTKQTRLSDGNIDRRMLAQLGMDLTNVFSRTRVDTFKPAMLHLTLDASGSMGGKPWYNALTVATALAYVGTKVRDIDVVITIRGGNDVALVSVVFDSRRDSFATFTKYMKHIRPNGGTPEGLCFEATKNIILESKNTHDVYFINFSDGEPGFSFKTNNNKWSYYSGHPALKHTRKIVQELRDAGVTVLSYFITDADNRYGSSTRSMENFRYMYGQDAVSVDVTNVTQVLSTMNKKLLARG